MNRKLISLLLLLLSVNLIFGNTNTSMSNASENSNYTISALTNTGLDDMLTIIRNDPGLIANIPTEEILEGMYFENEMNMIILNSIIKTNIAIDDNFSKEDMILLNSHINENYFESWTYFHGDDEGNGEETGYHLVQNDGGTTKIFGKNAVNTVIDGIYHLGFPRANEDQVQNEDGNANAKYTDLADWLFGFLKDDFEKNTLVGDLEKANLKLEVEKDISNNFLEFSIKVENEIFDLREVSIKPTIICNGAETNLKNDNGYLKSSALTSDISNTQKFDFKISLDDYVYKIPNNENCLFLVHLEDEFRTDLYLIEKVKFNTEKEIISNQNQKQNKIIPSVSGSSIDILNYMNMLVLNNIESGFNNLEFKIKNNQEESKIFTINLIVNKLKITQSSRIGIAGFDEEIVSMPLFIDEKIKKGMYPVRISVSNGDDKKTKYSYIKIN